MGELIGLLKFGSDGWGDELALGALLTLELALAVLPLGIVLGFLVALAKDSKYGALRVFGNIFTTVFRGLPELLTLFLVYFGGQILLQNFVGVFSDTYVELSAFVAGLLALGMVFAAFASEVFLGALRAVSKDQIEAARSLGMTEFTTMRLVVLPQLIRYALPGLGNQWLSMLKDTDCQALAVLPLGIVLGFLVALAKDSKYGALRVFGNIFTTVFRGLPELLTLFLVYFGGQILLQNFVGVFSDTYVELSAFVAGLLALGMVFAAFASEVFLGALRAVSKDQIEAARSLGMTEFTTMRLVVLPQLIRYALPGLGNQWLSMLKDTSLVSVIALTDLLRQTRIVVGATKEPFFFFLVACLLYLAMAVVSSFGQTALENWANRGERRA